MDENAETKPALPSGIVLCGDGKFRWENDYSMWKDPTVFFMVLGIILVIMIGLDITVFVLNVESGIEAAALFFLKFFGIGLAVSVGLALVGHAAAALIYGGKFCVVFEMDEKGVNNIQIQEHFAKAEVLDMIKAFAEPAENQPATPCAGLVGISRQSKYSSFASTKRIRILRYCHTIKLTALLSSNQVCTSREQFDFVLEYIRSHCPLTVKVR